MAEKVALEIDINAKGATTSLGQLEDEAERLNEELRKVPLGTKAFKDLKKELIGVNKQIKNTELSMEALDNEQVASELGSVAGAVGDVSAAFILLGGGGGAIEDTVRNIEKAIGVSMAFKGAIEGTQSAYKLFNNVIKNNNILTLINVKATEMAASVYSRFSDSVDVTSKSFKNLRTAIIATGIAALVVLVGSLIANFDTLISKITGVTKAKELLNSASLTAVDNISNEISASDKLSIILQDETISRQDKNKAITELQKKYPNLLSNIDSEKDSLEDINKALVLNTKLLILKAKSEAIASVRAEEYKKVVKAEIEADTGKNIGLMAILESMDGHNSLQGTANEITKKSIKETENNISALDELDESIQKQIASLMEQGAVIEDVAKKETKSKKKTTKEKIKEIEVTNELNQSLLNELDTKEKIVDFDLEDEEEPELELDFLNKTAEATKEKTRVKIEGIKNEIEQEKELRLQQLAWDEENVIQKAILDGVYTADQKLAIETDFQRKREAVIDEADQKILANQKAVEQAKIDLAVQGIGALINLTSAFAKDNEKSQRRAFEINKKLQIAQAIMSAYQGANAIFTAAALNPASILFPAQPFIAAGIAIVNGLANVANISKQQFQTSSPGGTQQQTPSFAGGGGGGTAPTLQPANTSTLVPQNQTQVFVTETDITSTQNSVSVIQGQATF
tara:strand:+ start:2002 stop:4059 length:2058 start_codon:yes stop_codon:yes gene_type:complete